MSIIPESTTQEDADHAPPSSLPRQRPPWSQYHFGRTRSSNNFNVSKANSSSSSKTTLEPSMSLEVLKNSLSIRISAERLYKIIHERWPSQPTISDTTLDRCSKAQLQLDPRWFTQGNREESFFIMLEGPGILQECKLHLSPISDTTVVRHSLRWASHRRWKDFCLYLGHDHSGELEAYPLISLRPKLQTYENLHDAVEFRLIPLEILLQELKPSFAAKKFMEMTLARSLLLLLDGPWVRTHLHLQNVSVFCRIVNGVIHPRFDKMFLSTSFGSAVDPDEWLKHNDTPLMPAILALGILFAEIELGTSLQTIYEGVDPELKVSDPVRVAQVLFKECEKEFGRALGVMRIMDSCFGPSPLHRTAWIPPNDGLIQNDTDFVNRYYANIVRPLEEDLVSLGWSWDEINGRTPRILGDAEVVRIFTSSIHHANDLLGHPQETTAPVIPMMEDTEQEIRLLSAEESTPDNHRPTGFRDVHKRQFVPRMDNFGESESQKAQEPSVPDTGADKAHRVFQDSNKKRKLDVSCKLVEPRGVEELHPS